MKPSELFETKETLLVMGLEHDMAEAMGQELGQHFMGREYQDVVGFGWVQSTDVPTRWDVQVVTVGPLKDSLAKEIVAWAQAFRVGYERGYDEGFTVGTGAEDED